MSYDYVQPDEFTPESRVNWISVGKVTKWTQEEEGIVDKFTLFLDGGLKLYIYFLSHCTFRVRFNPDPNAPYVKSRSPATEVERIEASKIKVKEEGEYLHIKTDRIEVSCLGVRGWEVFSSSGMPQKCSAPSWFPRYYAAQAVAVWVMEIVFRTLTNYVFESNRLYVGCWYPTFFLEILRRY